MGAFLCIEISSLFIGDSFVDYRYYLHFNIKTLSMAGGFIKEIILLALIFTGAACTLFFLSKLVRKSIVYQKKGSYRIVCIAILITSLFTLVLLPSGIYSGLKEIYNIVSTNEEYKGIFPKSFKASGKNKNIIIISLESFNSSLLHEANRNLTPNIQKRKQEWAYYDVFLNYGSGWTAGSLYTVFTGMPALFPGLGNEYFKGAKKSKFITLSSILKKCGYTSYHLSNDAEFAGTKDLLTTLGVDFILGGDFNGKYKDLVWGGAYDMDIFAEAKEIVKQRCGKPFMLFVATTQTHAPDGFVDERVVQHIEPQATVYENAVLSTDWLVEDFIHFFENENMLDETVIYLFPDHFFYGTKEVFKKADYKTRLWLMTNAEKERLPADTVDIYQVDIPRIILSGAEIEHDVTFFSDTITGNKDDYIRKHIQELSALNMFSIVRENTIGKSFVLSLNKEHLIGMLNGEDLFVKKRSELGDDYLLLLIDEQLKIMEIKQISRQEFDNGFNEPCHTCIKIGVENANIDFEWTKDADHKRRIHAGASLNLNSEQILDVIKEIDQSLATRFLLLRK
jgi:phosphoglycerol transferase